MRILLAMVAFVIAVPPLAYGAVVARIVIAAFREGELDWTASHTLAAVARSAGGLLLGFVFLSAGIAVLATKPRQK